MRPIVVVGAGQIGTTLARLLAGSGSYAVKLVDRDAEALARIDGVTPLIADASDPARLAGVLEGTFAVVSALPFYLTIPVAEAAAQAGVHYLDLTEDVASTRVVTQLAQAARTAFIPQCGVAPGFVSIAAGALVRTFDAVDAVRLRVGALPRSSANALGYNLTWSTDGLINEYCEPCDAIVAGRLQSVAALSNVEGLTLDGTAYEAFNTSGGLGSLCETLMGRVRALDYKTIRYPGHAAIMRTLLDDLRLREQRPVLKTILETALPATDDDVVVIHVTVQGRRQDRFVEDSYSARITAGLAAGAPASAIQITTASAACAALDLLAEGLLPQAGLIRQETIPLQAFLGNRFGQVYDVSKASLRLTRPVRPPIDGHEARARVALHEALS